MSATPAAVSPVRAVRRVLDQLERALRPVDASVEDADASAVSDGRARRRPLEDDLDSTTTTELLIPTSDEPHAARASRQAQAYLERRRRKLNRLLEDC